MMAILNQFLIKIHLRIVHYFFQILREVEICQLIRKVVKNRFRNKVLHQAVKKKKSRQQFIYRSNSEDSNAKKSIRFS